MTSDCVLPDFFFSFESPLSEPFDPEESAFLTATAAAPVAAAAAAAFIAVRVALPPLPLCSSVAVFSFSAMWGPLSRSAGALGARAGSLVRVAPAELVDAAHERVVDCRERLGGLVGVLADLVGELDQPVEVA